MRTTRREDGDKEVVHASVTVQLSHDSKRIARPTFNGSHALLAIPPSSSYVGVHRRGDGACHIWTIR